MDFTLPLRSRAMGPRYTLRYTDPGFVHKAHAEAVDGAVGAQNPAGEAFPAGIDLPNAEKPPISERLQTNW